MKAIKSNGEEYEMPIKESLIVIAQILEGYDGNETIQGLKDLIDEVKGYIYYEAKRMKEKKIKIITMFIILSMAVVVLGILIQK